MSLHERLSIILSRKKTLEGISAADIARLVGVTRATLSDWKVGKSRPGVEATQRLAVALGVSVSELLGEPTPQHVDMSQWATLKVIGRIPAGVEFEAIQEYDGEVVVPPDQARPGCFALRVVGESMTPTILNGDVVIVAPCVDMPRANQVVVIRVNLDGEVTLKRFTRDGQNIILIADNPAFPPRILTPDSHIRILGVVVGLSRRLG